MSEIQRIYLDYAATTPINPSVLTAMKPYFSVVSGNPNSLHSEGQAAQAALDRAREALRRMLGHPPAGGFREVIFTGSATEANNLALRGTVKKFLISNFQFPKKQPKIIVSAIEHESVLETAEDLRRDGIEVVVLPVDREGAVDLRALERALDPRTVLVSVMYANNEIGTIQPLAAIAELIKNWKSEIGNSSPYPFLHSDAVQAFQWLECGVTALGVDLMTLSAHKIYGPKGIGALYVRDQRPITNNQQHGTSGLQPIITGGGQEFGMRAGTQNVPAAAGFAAAASAVAARRGTETERVRKLGERFWTELQAAVPGVELNGAPPLRRALHALPNIWNVSFPRHCAKDLVVRFDMEGIAVSAGAACASRAPKRSYVLSALGIPEERAANGVRFSFGRSTTVREVDETVRRIARCLAESVT